jgi:hypothetical protein
VNGEACSAQFVISYASRRSLGRALRESGHLLVLGWASFYRCIVFARLFASPDSISEIQTLTGSKGRSSSMKLNTQRMFAFEFTQVSDG